MKLTCKECGGDMRLVTEKHFSYENPIKLYFNDEYRPTFGSGELILYQCEKCKRLVEKD